MKVLIAPDSFKGSASASEVARLLAQGWRETSPQDQIVICPLGDGGEGSLDTILVADSSAKKVEIEVIGPDDRNVLTYYVLLEDGTAVIELANTSGIGLINQLAPMSAHTRGFGQAINYAIKNGAKSLLLCIGGSCSTDGGVGALTELGYKFMDKEDKVIGFGGGVLKNLNLIDGTKAIRIPSGGVKILSDVQSPLLGSSGAAKLFGKQKGATALQIETLEQNLAHFADVAKHPSQIPGAGAAGGTAYGLMLWGGVITSGASEISKILNLAEKIKNSDVVITGEGSFDEQSKFGKLPIFVRNLANEYSKRTFLIAGVINASTEMFAGAKSLTDIAGNQKLAYQSPSAYLVEAGEQLALLSRN